MFEVSRKQALLGMVDVRVDGESILVIKPIYGNDIYVRLSDYGKNFLICSIYEPDYDCRLHLIADDVCALVGSFMFVGMHEHDFEVSVDLREVTNLYNLYCWIRDTGAFSNVKLIDDPVRYWLVRIYGKLYEDDDLRFPMSYEKLVDELTDSFDKFRQVCDRCRLIRTKDDIISSFANFVKHVETIEELKGYLFYQSLPNYKGRQPLIYISQSVRHCNQKDFAKLLFHFILFDDEEFDNFMFKFLKRITNIKVEDRDCIDVTDFIRKRRVMLSGCKSDGC